MNCPICNIPLTMAERQGVEIDYCSKCRGVWLDRGELDKIIERATLEMTSRPAQAERNEGHHDQYYEKHHDKHHDKHYDDHGHHKRKKGFLQELFD